MQAAVAVSRAAAHLRTALSLEEAQLTASHSGIGSGEAGGEETVLACNLQGSG